MTSVNEKAAEMDGERWIKNTIDMKGMRVNGQRWIRSVLYPLGDVGRICQRRDEGGNQCNVIGSTDTTPLMTCQD